MEVQDILKRRRIELGLTQDDVAKHVGVSETTVSRWESGNIANMRRSRIVKLAEVLQISPGVIMGWADEPEQRQRVVPDSPKLAILFKRTRVLSEKQLDIVLSIVDEMSDEHE